MVVQELPAVKEVAAHVAHRPLHLPFGLGPVGSAGAGREAPVRAEAEELGIVNQPAPVEPLILRDDRPHLIEEQLPGDTAEERERLLKARQQGSHVLAREEAQPQELRVAEHHEEGVALAPRQPEVREVHLGLMARRGLEAHDGLGFTGPDLPDVLLQLCVAARVAGSPDLLQEPHGGELRQCLQPGLDDRLEGIELGRHRRPRSIPRNRRIDVSVEVALRDPAVDSSTVYAKALGDHRLREPSGEVVSQQHAFLPSDHRHLRLKRGRATWTSGPSLAPRSPTSHGERRPESQLRRVGHFRTPEVAPLTTSTPRPTAAEFARCCTLSTPAENRTLLGVNPRGWTVGVGWIDRLRVSGCIHTLEFLRRPVAEGGVQASSIVYLLKEVGESVG